MDLLGLAGKDLDDDVGDDACADAGGDVGGERAEDDHHEGAEGLSEVGEVDLGQAADHQEAHEDQGRAGGGVGDYHEQGGGEDGQQEHDAGGEGGEAGAAACLHARGGLHKGGDGGVAGAGTHAGTDGVHQEGLLNAGEVAVFVQHLGLTGHAQNGAQGGEEVTKEGDEDPDGGAGGEQAAEIEVEADGAQVAEIGDGKGMSGENGDAEGDAQNGDDGNANEDGALDIIGGQHADDGQAQNGQQHAGLGEVAHADAAVEAADAGIAEAQISNEEANGC